MTPAKLFFIPTLITSRALQAFAKPTPKPIISYAPTFETYQPTISYTPTYETYHPTISYAPTSIPENITKVPTSQSSQNTTLSTLAPTPLPIPANTLSLDNSTVDSNSTVGSRPSDDSNDNNDFMLFLLLAIPGGIALYGYFIIAKDLHNINRTPDIEQDTPQTQNDDNSSTIPQSPYPSPPLPDYSHKHQTSPCSACWWKGTPSSLEDSSNSGFSTDASDSENSIESEAHLKDDHSSDSSNKSSGVFHAN